MMAAFDQAILWMDVFAFLFVLVCLVYLKKSRDFERIELENSLNALLFGVFFLFIIMLANVLVSLQTVYAATLTELLPEIGQYVGYLTNIVELALFPLFAVCFLVSILVARNYLVQKEEK